MLGYAPIDRCAPTRSLGGANPTYGLRSRRCWVTRRSTDVRERTGLAALTQPTPTSRPSQLHTSWICFTRGSRGIARRGKPNGHLQHDADQCVRNGRAGQPAGHRRRQHRQRQHDRLQARLHGVLLADPGERHGRVRVRWRGIAHSPCRLRAGLLQVHDLLHRSRRQGRRFLRRVRQRRAAFPDPRRLVRAQRGRRSRQCRRLQADGLPALGRHTEHRHQRHRRARGRQHRLAGAAGQSFRGRRALPQLAGYRHGGGGRQPSLGQRRDGNLHRQDLARCL